jgi:protein SCO1/2
VGIPGRKLLLGLLGVLVVAVVPAVVVPMLMHRGEHRALEDIGTVAPFKLVDERAQTFTEEALYGKVSIVAFIFTRCDTICPVTSMKMARIQDKTFDLGRDIKLVSFSIDPEYDTPDKLAAYAKRYGADPERWRFVTGPAAEIHKTVEGSFMTAMDDNGIKANGLPDIVHRGYFLLVDRALHIRGIYDSDRINQLDELMSDARYLARTQR